MKIFKLSIIILLLAMVSGPILAQNVGELERFDGEKLEKRNDVKLYPNPTVDYLSVHIANSDLKDIRFTVHNILGNEVEVKIEQVDDDTFKIDAESLPTGYYLLAIKDDTKQFRETYKFLKR